ncbi:MAG: IS5 family transposase [Gammaproteobacteria bacterium]
MRGADTRQEGLFSYVSPESRIPENHPLREIRPLTDAALAALSADFEAAYSPLGRPSIAPEKLVRALLLQVFYSVRSERLLMEQLDYNLLFRWFVGLAVDEPVWVPTVFTHNRERLLEAEIVHKFFAQVLAQVQALGLTSDEHFSVDGTLIEAWASMKSFRPKDKPPPPGIGRNATVDFRGETRTNDSHESTTDPDCRLYKKAQGQAAKLCHLGHLLMENRHGFIVGTTVTPPTGNAEREAAVQLAGELPGELPGAYRKTLGGDKGYDTHDCVQELREIGVTPHLAQNDTHRRSALDRRTTHHPGYVVSLRIRKLIETRFGWMKDIGTIRKTKRRGTVRVDEQFRLNATAFNLLHLSNLLRASPA